MGGTCTATVTRKGITLARLAFRWKYQPDECDEPVTVEPAGFRRKVEEWVNGNAGLSPYSPVVGSGAPMEWGNFWQWKAVLAEVAKGLGAVVKFDDEPNVPDQVTMPGSGAAL